MLQTNYPMGPPGLQPAHALSVRGAPNTRSNKVAVLLLVALAGYAFARVEQEPARSEHGRAAPFTGATVLAAPFSRPIELDNTCDGRAVCPQTNSCTDAKAFSRSCSGVDPDRDANVDPCGNTWCPSPLAN